MSESIFKSSLRKLLHAFAIIIGLFIALLPIMIILSFLTADSSQLDKYKVTILPDLNGKKEILPLNTPAILRIDLKGIIGQKKLCTEDMYNLLIESRKGLLKDNRIKGILLNITTPGGSVNDSDGIYRLLLDYKKKYNVPIYAYVDGMCASGGMYIASAADQIYSNPVSIIGSIGVRVGPFFNVSETMGKVGIEALTIMKGKDKDALSPFRKWAKDEGQDLSSITSYLYNRFVHIFTLARTKVNKTQLINDYGAKIFDSITAEKIGYIDHGISNYHTALKDLLAKAKVDMKKPYQVIELTSKQTLLTYFSEAQSLLSKGEITHKIQLGDHDFSNINEKFSYLYAPELDMQ